MLWQYPGGHLVPANGSEPIVNYDQTTHGGAGGTWIFGDTNIGSNIDNISPTQLGIALAPGAYRGATNVRSLLMADNGYNWSQSQLSNLASLNMFSILWGGGNTTSITNIAGNGDDDGWLAGKVKTYLKGNQVYKSTACSPTSGMNNKTLDNNIIVYPNPTDGHFSFDMPGWDKNIVVEVLTSVGVRVYKKTLSVGSDRRIEMNISEFPKGMYLVNVRGDSKQYTVKILKY
jgi:hypothetical protein